MTRQTGRAGSALGLVFNLPIRLAVFVVVLALPRYAGAVESFCPGGSSPRSDIVFCEDWETYNPVTNAAFPDTENSTFNSWTAVNEGRPDGHGYVQSTTKHAGTYALRQQREANGNFTAIVRRNITATADFRMRFYVYLQSPFGNAGVSDEDNIHLIFLNTDASFTGQRMDFVPYINTPTSYDPWPPTCVVSGGPNAQQVHLTVNSENARFKGVTLNRSDLCFNWQDHYNEWVLVEWSYKVTGGSTGTAGLWINGVQMMINEDLAPDPSHLTTSSVWLSGYWSTNSSVEANVYFDDIVVSNNSALTIGPTGGSGSSPPGAPTNVRVQ